MNSGSYRTHRSPYASYFEPNYTNPTPSSPSSRDSILLVVLILVVSLFLTKATSRLLSLFAELYYRPAATIEGIVEMLGMQISGMVRKVGTVGLGGVDWSSVGSEDEDSYGGVEGMNDYVKNASVAGGSGIYYPGLLNAAGNLCFLNATLQSMASTPHLLIYLRRTISLASSLQPPFSTPVTSALHKTLSALNTPSTSYPPPLRPIELAQALAHSSSLRMQLLSSTDQQDAHELWGMIREAVEEELLRVERECERSNEGGLAEVLRMAMMSNAKGKGKRRAMGKIKDPYLMLLSQRVTCMTCGYTRDVRHMSEEQVGLSVPPVVSNRLVFSSFSLIQQANRSYSLGTQQGCHLKDLLAEYTKREPISDYACRRCSLSATHQKLMAQVDRLSLSTPSQSSPTTPSSMASSSSSSSPFIAPPPPDQPFVMTQSKKDRRKKVQKLVERVKLALDAGDFEKELGSEIKVERVEGLAGKQVRFARTPDILTIHLNRSAHYGRHGAVKNSAQILFPEILDLTPYTDHSSSDESLDSPIRDLYRLSSLVVHYGTHSFGHYVAFRRHPNPPPLASPTSLSVSSILLSTSAELIEADTSPPSGTSSPSPSTSQATPRLEAEWFRISDETVQTSDLNEALSANPFLLFYERILPRAIPEQNETLISGNEIGNRLLGLTRKRSVVPRLIESWRLGNDSAEVEDEVGAEEEAPGWADSAADDDHVI